MPPRFVFHFINFHLEDYFNYYYYHYIILYYTYYIDYRRHSQETHRRGCGWTKRHSKMEMTLFLDVFLFYHLPHRFMRPLSGTRSWTFGVLQHLTSLKPCYSNNLRGPWGALACARPLSGTCSWMFEVLLQHATCLKLSYSNKPYMGLLRHAHICKASSPSFITSILMYTAPDNDDCGNNGDDGLSNSRQSISLPLFEKIVSFTHPHHHYQQHH